MHRWGGSDIISWATCAQAHARFLFSSVVWYSHGTVPGGKRCVPAGFCVGCAGFVVSMPSSEVQATGID